MSDPEEIEEERRLCYVGLTRARDRLYLSYALHRRVHGYGVGEPSRFLREMPQDQILALNVRSEPHRRRSEEHTSELQSLAYLVCRLLLEKKKKTLPHRARQGA